MGWETRRGRRYYYGKERTADGRVRSVYLGTGEVCEVLAECAEGRRIEARQRRRAFRRTFDPIDAALDALRESEAWLRVHRDAYLTATGHRSHRGQWRRRRGLDLAPFTLPPPDDDPPARRPGDMAKKTQTPEVIRVQADSEEHHVALVEAMHACDTEDPSSDDVDRLRALLRSRPDGRVTTYLRERTRRQLATYAGGSDTIRRELAAVEAEEFEKGLREDGDSRLVWHACRHAADCWLVLCGVQRGYSYNLSDSYNQSSGDHWERRLNSAQTRYLRALATVTKLREVEGKERRRAERHAASRPALPLPRHAGDGHASADSVELAVT